jgi:transposase
MQMERILGKKERENLICRHRQERDKRICDRIKAILAYDDGYTYSEIAKILLLDDETIRRHIEDYLRENKLFPENGGSESFLTEKEAKELIEHLQEITYLYVKDICIYVKETFKKKYSISGMTKWLHANEFCYKKPHGVPAKANKEEQKEFIKYYNQLKEETDKKEPIYFVDSVHPQYQTHLTYGWILKGERKLVPTTARQPRLNFMGGICLDNHHILYQQADTVDVDSIAGFLCHLRKHHPGKYKIHIIWDNAGYHSDLALQEFAKNLAIELHYLPPYSPNLNPIERLWKMMKEKVSANKYYENFNDFTEATLNFFKNIGRNKLLLRSRITDNFQIAHSPLFAS